MYLARDDNAAGQVWLFNTKPVKDKGGIWGLGRAMTANCIQVRGGFPPVKRGQCIEVKLIKVECEGDAAHDTEIQWIEKGFDRKAEGTAK